MTPARARVCEEALSWIDTPYHHRGRIKGVGVDCAGLVIEVFRRTGVIENIEPGEYVKDWMQHRSEQMMLGFLNQYAYATNNPQPGDIVAYTFGKCVSHLAIIIDWPSHVVHAVARHKRVTSGFGNRGDFSTRRVFGFYTPQGLE